MRQRILVRVAGVCGPILLGTALCTAGAHSTAQPTSKRAAGFSRLPWSFEVNQGQSASPVRFLARRGAQTFFLAPDGVVFSSPAQPLGIRLSGSLTPVSMAASGELPWKSNYFIGRDPSGWKTDIRQYSRVRYGEVYPGIDLVFHAAQGHLEFDFIAGPGSDPGAIRLRFEGGAGEIAIDPEGNLVLPTPSGRVLLHKPVVYQEANGAQESVAGGFVLQGNGEVGFRLGRFDRERPLIIDPVLSYSTFLGGTGDDRAWGIAVDSLGSAYVTGITASVDLPSTPGAFQEDAPGGASDIFVAKLNPAGDAFEYLTYLGGTPAGIEQGFAIAVDSQGAAFITGETNSAGFPVTEGAFNPTQDGSAFVAKLSPGGDQLVYSTYLGGNSLTVGYGIAVDGAGNAYVTGEAAGDDFPSTPGSFQPEMGGDRDAFITKLNPEGSALVYSSFLGGTDREAGYDVAVDGDGNAYLTGYTTSDDFPTANAFQTATAGGADVFVTKVNSDGSALAYSTYLGGSGGAIGDRAFGIAVDSSGSAYLTGLTGSTDFPVTEGALDVIRGANNDDAFVTKLSPDGSSLVYSTYLGGDNTERGAGIAVDSEGHAYVAGRTVSNNFPTVGAIQGDSAGTDAFVCKLSIDGSALDFSTYLGGEDNDSIGATGGDPDGNPIALDPGGAIYVAGWTESADFPLVDPLQAQYGGGFFDAFAAKIFEAETQDLIFAQFGNGGGLTSDILLVNSSPSVSVTGSVAFRDDAGNPLDVGIAAAALPQGSAVPAGNAGQSSVDFALEPLGSTVISTDGLGDLPAVGSAVASSSGRVGGVIRFSIPGIGIAGVGASQPVNRFATPARRVEGGINTGIALYNPEDQPVTLTLTLRDPQGQTIAGGETTIPPSLPALAAKGHLAKFINELFPEADLSDFTGILEVSVADGKRVAATALQLGTQPGEFTTLPVVPIG